jgi:hypothetical protein
MSDSTTSINDTIPNMYDTQLYMSHKVYMTTSDVLPAIQELFLEIAYVLHSFTPNSFRELKRGVSRKMIRTRSPKVLWDHCIELEALIKSHSVNTIYETNGQVPETLMTGTTADISHISEFGWYDWVMFRDNTPTFPDNNIVLGQYLGPATDVGGMMTAKILKENGQFVYRSTLRHLTKDEIDSTAHADMRTRFDKLIKDTLGPGATDADFDPEDLTPELQPYDDDYDFGVVKGEDDMEPDKVTPKTGDNYINA